MSDEQQQETPVWHSIVGEGYEPVLIGEVKLDKRRNGELM